MEMRISAIPPELWYYLQFVLPQEEEIPGSYHVALSTIIQLTTQVRESIEGVLLVVEDDL